MVICVCWCSTWRCIRLHNSVSNLTKHHITIILRYDYVSSYLFLLLLLFVLNTLICDIICVWERKKQLIHIWFSQLLSLCILWIHFVHNVHFWVYLALFCTYNVVFVLFFATLCLMSHWGVGYFFFLAFLLIL